MSGDVLTPYSQDKGPGKARHSLNISIQRDKPRPPQLDHRALTPAWQTTQQVCIVLQPFLLLFLFFHIPHAVCCQLMWAIGRGAGGRGSQRVRATQKRFLRSRGWFQSTALADTPRQLPSTARVPPSAGKLFQALQ